MTENNIGSGINGRMCQFFLIWLSLSQTAIDRKKGSEILIGRWDWPGG